MKRTLLGVATLVVVVGLGSLGVFLVHRWSAPTTPEVAEPNMNSFASTRDVAPIPIPLNSASQDEPLPGAGNPFGAGMGSAERVVSAQDRYTSDNTPVAQETRTSETPIDNDIPDARDLAAGRTEMPATQAGDPFGSRQRGIAPAGRLVEQPTASELADVDQPDSQAERPRFTDANEPRPLTRVPARRQVDRYGRADDSRQVRDTRQQTNEAASVEEPVATPQRQDEPVGEASDTESSDEGTGRPGDPQLSGSQAPTLTIEKTAPEEIQIGKPAKFVIKVRNAGSVAAQGVEIHDSIPQGTQLISTTPQAQRGPQGSLIWDLGALRPGDEQTAEIELMPTAEGEIGSVATIHFRAEASVRTMATKPVLVMEVSAPEQVMKGDELTLKIKLSNPGSGAATKVVISENVPQGLTHPAGSELEFDVGTLKPGESRELELDLVAATAGTVTNVVTAQADANLEVEAAIEVEVIAPQLQVSMAGPKRRYLERNATHNISITNPGTAVAKNVDLVAVLPKELKFVEANNGGQFDEATHSVYWSLEELPPQESGTVTLTTLPMQPGDAKLLIKSAAQSGLADQREEIVTIEGLAAINFQLSDVNDPIEAGGHTSYEVRVTNQGSKAASNVRLVALMPRGMKAISAEGPVRYKIEGQRVVFEPLRQLAPKADTSYTIKAQALQQGDLRVQVQVSTDEIREPISKEESTRVYGDE